MWAFLFLILRQCGKNHIPFTRADFKTSQYVSDDPKENFVVYVYIVNVNVYIFVLEMLFCMKNLILRMRMGFSRICWVF